MDIRLGEAVHLDVQQEREARDHREDKGRVRRAEVLYPQETFRRKLEAPILPNFIVVSYEDIFAIEL